MLNNTPVITNYVKKHTSDDPAFLRTVGEAGVVTYSEYLFLLSVITKPQSGQLVAFKIIDVSNENTILADEFSQVQIKYQGLDHY